MKTRFIPVELFSKRYGVTIDSVYNYKNNSKHKNNGIKKLENGGLFVDENYFLRRQNFRTKIKMMAQENYYFLTSSISSYQLAKLLSKYSGESVQGWVNFIWITLFAVDDNSIIYLKSFKKLWQFFRLTRALIRAVFKIVEVPVNKRDYNKMYDYKYGKIKEKAS